MIKKKMNKKIEPIDFSKISKEYERKWVVIAKNNKDILKSGESINDLTEYLDKGTVVFVPSIKYTISPKIEKRRIFEKSVNEKNSNNRL
jgi:hypothetical protein